MIKQIPYSQVEINGGFWQQRQQLNHDVTAPSVYHQFDQTGRNGAFRCDWKPGEPNEPHYCWDSAVAKWIEGAAYILAQHPDARLEAEIDQIVDDLAANQQPDGYFNIYYTVVEPGKRFTMRSNHELYCAGHLIEAAVAYAQATGKTKLLDCMVRYAELIDRVFRVEHSAAFDTPGHEEIELALVRLADYTGEARWLELARYFINTRGCSEKDIQNEKGDHTYNQSHLPVRQQRTAEGHAVRAEYLYCAMADLAARDGDQSLADACHTLFDNIFERRMYVTGATGSSHYGENFTVDYDLGNLHAYAESCASIALAMFARRMEQLEPDGRYGDVIERVLYNGFLSSTSLDGKSFFYENPLEIRPALIGRNHCVHWDPRCEHFPITQRVEVFFCSCCPPNILRFMASAAGLLYSADEDACIVYVHQYMASSTSFDFGGGTAHLTQETDYPVSGKVRLTWHGPDATLALRVPGWVRDWGEPTQRGYIHRTVTDGSVVELDFPMPVRFVTANPNVQEDSGRCAVMRGPVVYCMEAVDNGDNLRDVRLIPGTDALAPSRCGLPAIAIDAVRRAPMDTLYGDLRDRAFVPFRARLIPYFAFANRGQSEMLVWAQVQGAD